LIDTHADRSLTSRRHVRRQGHHQIQPQHHHAPAARTVRAAGIVVRAKGTIMHIVHPTYLTLIVATHPAKPDEYAAPIIIAFAMLAITKLEADGWRFGLSSGIADTLNDEERVLIELADALPHPRFVIGDDIERRISRSVTHAADRASLIVAAHVRQRMARLLSAVRVDLSVPPVGSSTLTPALDIAVQNRTIVDPVAACAALADRAIDLWLRFLGQPKDSDHGPTRLATEIWLKTRMDGHA
jgi:hypothetical protein